MQIREKEKTVRGAVSVIRGVPALRRPLADGAKTAGGREVPGGQPPRG